MSPPLDRAFRFGHTLFAVCTLSQEILDDPASDSIRLCLMMHHSVRLPLPETSCSCRTAAYRSVVFRPVGLSHEIMRIESQQVLIISFTSLVRFVLNTSHPIDHIYPYFRSVTRTAQIMPFTRNGAHSPSRLPFFGARPALAINNIKELPSACSGQRHIRRDSQGHLALAARRGASASLGWE